MLRCLGLLLGALLAVSVAADPGRATTDGSTRLESLRAEVEAAADGEAPAPADPLHDFVDGVTRTLLAEHELPAMTVAVVQDDALRLARAWGRADLVDERVATAEDTLFRIGSVSKTFIWTAVMMLVERGLLDLDADVNGYLRALRVAPAFGAPVTMRHLMHHRAGFEDSLRLFAVADDDPRTLAELLAEHQPRRVFPPGSRTSYSNWGSALAAQIVEDVAEMPYGEFLRREILAPLGMDQTTWQAPARMDAETRRRLASGYRRGLGALEPQAYMQLGAYWPAGGMASTATDMARWMRLHLNGGELDGVRLLGAETHAALWQRGFDDRPGAADLAHGFQDRTYRGLRLLGHAGGTAAFLSNMVLVPELGLGVFLSQNGAYHASALRQLPERIIDFEAGFDRLPAVAVEANGSAQLDALAGTYLQNRRVFSSFGKLLALGGATRVDALAADALRVSAAGETRQFRAVEGQTDVFEAADGGRIAFLRDAAGRVVALADDSGVHTLERVGMLDAPNTLFVALGLAGLFSVSCLLGFWWRLGRTRVVGPGSAVASAAALFGCVSVILLLIAAVRLAASFSDFDLAAMPGNYPTPQMLHLHYAGWLLAAAAALMLLALWPAWVASRWSLWRKLHYAAHALTLGVLALLLWQWRVIGAPLH